MNETSLRKLNKIYRVFYFHICNTFSTLHVKIEKKQINCNWK